ncbi:MAG: M48 family metalloprotease [Isosphaeraceae bacterium]
MPIRVECPGCGGTFRVADASAGKRGKCPRCQGPIVVPAAEAAPDVAEPVPPAPAPEPETYALAEEQGGARYLATSGSSGPRGPAPRSRAGSRAAPAPAPQAPAPGKLSPAEILAGFRGEIPRIRPSIVYRLWILIVAAAMLLLPLLYLAIVGLACYAMYWHATHNYVVFRDVRNAKAALFVYLGPMAVLAILIFFLFKPLFASRERRTRERSLDPSQEPLLFAFVDAVCAAVGAPTPVRIDVDCAVNASAGPERGFFSLFRKRLVLTVGLPLAATMTLREFAGVLAHEFGHFSQSAGMQLTYLVRSINAWFYRVVYERDEWDATLDAWSKEGHIATILLAYLARLFVWLTRRILWVLMMAGHAISCIMSRQMEYDADRYQARLVGSPMVESVLRQVNVVVAAERGAFYDLGENWKEGRLADNLPRLIAANVSQIPAEGIKAINAGIDRGKTGFFDTHPADRDRFAAARRVDAPGIFHLDGPASDLFRDFDALSRAATIDYYRAVFGPGFTPDNLQPVSEVVQGTESLQAGQKALERLLLGSFTPARGLPLPGEPPLPPEDRRAAMRRLKQLRDEQPVVHEGYGLALSRQGDALGKLAMAEAATMMSRAGFKFKAADFHVPAANLDAAQTAAQRADRQVDEQSQALAEFERLCSERLTTALGLLEDDAVAGRMNDPDPWRDEVRALYPIATFLAGRVWPRVLPLMQARIALLSVLQHYQGNEQNERLTNAILRGGRELRDRLQELKTALGGSLLYPFDHAQGEVTLEQFALPSVPAHDSIGDLLRAAETALDRLLPLYSRVLGRLALAAEEVERALGLPLLDPPASP